jgi:hypothetical protein
MTILLAVRKTQNQPKQMIQKAQKAAVISALFSPTKMTPADASADKQDMFVFAVGAPPAYAPAPAPAPVFAQTNR